VTIPDKGDPVLEALTEPKQQRRLLLTREVAEMCGVSPATVKSFVRSGQLAPVPFSRGRWLRFWSDEVERLLGDAPPDPREAA
jgi:predicted DNA-binding transcriptional regulator AlpA